MTACYDSQADKACEAGTSPTTSDRSVVRRGIRAKHGCLSAIYRCLILLKVTGEIFRNEAISLCGTQSINPG